MGKVIISSPEITRKSFGTREINFIACTISPAASFIPMILEKSFASRCTVAGKILEAVRPGTLYIITGLGATAANAL